MLDEAHLNLETVEAITTTAKHFVCIVLCSTHEEYSFSTSTVEATLCAKG